MQYLSLEIYTAVKLNAKSDKEVREAVARGSVKALDSRSWIEIVAESRIRWRGWLEVLVLQGMESSRELFVKCAESNRSVRRHSDDA